MNKTTKTNKTKKIETNNPELIAACFQGGISNLVFWSFRYFTGRMTIATCCFADELAKSWPLLDEHVQHLIRKELDELFEKDDKMRAELKPHSYYPLGMTCGREHWEKVRVAYNQNPHKTSN